MRVLHVISRLDEESGGHSRSVPQQIAVSNRLGTQTDIITERRPARLVEEVGMVRRSGGRLFLFSPLGVRGMFWASGPAARRMASVMRRYDLVHINGVWSPICHLGAAVAHTLSKPLVITPHGMLQPWPLRQKWLKKWAARLVYQDRDLGNAAVIRSTSSAEAGQLHRLGVKAPIAIIPNGVYFPPRLHRVKHTGPRLGVFLSRIHPKKGLVDLVHAVGDLGAKLRTGGWNFIVAGYGSQRHLSAAKRLSARLGVADLFSFVGRVEGAAKWRLLSSADLFVLPSYGENFGLVVAEALVAGLPVITTRETPWSELESCRCGWWVPVGAPSLCKALAQATSLPRPVLRRMGERGKDLIVQRYSWKRVTFQLLAVYHWLLGRARRPATIWTPDAPAGRE